MKTIALILIVGAGCRASTTTMPACSPETCEGCCVDDTHCASGSDDFYCGSRGASCVDCLSPLGACVNGVCVAVSGGGGDMASCATPCASQCCLTGAICIHDSAGNEMCAKSCVTNAECSGADGTCCMLLKSGGGACIAPQSGLPCRCATSADCARFPATPACAPAVSSDVIQVKPLICKPNDAAAWSGCNPGAGACCPTNYDCLGDAAGNRYCARTCSTTAQCGNANACCVTNATCHDCLSGCSSGGCMPCP